MPARTSSFLVVLALVLAACAGGEATSTTTDTAMPTTTTEQIPDALLLSYSLEPGSSFTYEVTLDQQIDLVSEGDPTAAGDREIPAEMSISLNGATQFTHTVSEGSEPGTYEVQIQGEFTDLAFDGTIDGEPAESGAIPDVADIPPIDVTIVVDEQGNVIPQGGELGDLFGGELGGLSGFGDMAPGTDLGRLVGPPMSDTPVTVGDMWSKTVEVPMPMVEGGPITTEITSEVTSVDTFEGEEVLVIETQTVTSMIRFDLAEFLIGFFSSFMPEDATAEDQAELDALMEDLKFLFDIDETIGEMTTLFDAEAGFARKADFASSTHMVMDINMPDQTTGELIAFVLDMNIDQSADYRLIDSTNA